MADPGMRTFQSTVTPVQVRVEWNNIKYLVDAVTGAPVGIQNPNANGADGMWTPIEVSHEQASRPDAYLKADINSTYRLNVPPYTRYISTGSSIVEVVTTPVGGGGGGATTPGLPLTGGTLTGPLTIGGTGSNALSITPGATANDPVALLASGRGGLGIANLPTSAQAPGILWNNVGAMNIGAGAAAPSKKGITDGSNAAAGDIGEFISASVQVGAAISAVSQTPIDITTMVLTAGDWDLLGQVGTQAAPGGHIQHMQVWMGTASVTPPTIFAGAFHEVGGISTGSTEQMVLPTGRLRMNLTTASTTVYLSTRIQFTGTLSCYGFMSARRVR